MSNEKRRRALELMKKYYGGIVESESKIVPPELETVSISGTILNFNTNISRLLENLILHLEPTQSGSGDPSPSNIRPITGYDSVSVVRAGKNLYRYPYSSSTKTQGGITYTDNGDGSITVNGTATSTVYFNLTVWADDYVPLLRTAGAELTITGGTSDVRIFAQYREAGSTDAITLGIDNGSGVTFTVPDVVDTYISYLRVNNGVTINNVTIRPMIRLASITDDTYEPYQSATYPIFLSSAGTVYGGTLDVTTGVLTVDRAMVDLGTLPWRYVAGFNCYYSYLTAAIGQQEAKVGFNAICSIYPFVGAYNALTDKSCAYIYNQAIAVMDSAYADVDTFKTAMNGVQLVYELATPQTYHLTPTEVTTLIGYNTIWMDAEGTIDAEYWRIKQ